MKSTTTTINLKSGELLVVDPCYIKCVSDGKDDRYDALKHIKTIHEGDDGYYDIIYNDAEGNSQVISLGVDSGRLWVTKAEFGCEVEVCTAPGYTYAKLPKDTDTSSINKFNLEDYDL
mgnify:CR=1 FL=1